MQVFGSPHFRVTGLRVADRSESRVLVGGLGVESSPNSKLNPSPQNWAFSIKLQAGNPSEEVQGPDGKLAFLELFAGKGGVTKVVREALRGIERGTLWTRMATVVETLERIRKHKPAWTHMAPPCRTFTRARDDRFGTRAPGGSGPTGSREAGAARRRRATYSPCGQRLSPREQEKGGRLFTIEHLRSYMWNLKPFKKRRKEGRGAGPVRFRRPASQGDGSADQRRVLHQRRVLLHVGKTVPGSAEALEPPWRRRARKDPAGQWQRPLRGTSSRTSRVERPGPAPKCLGRRCWATRLSSPSRPGAGWSAGRSRDPAEWRAQQENETCVGCLRSPAEWSAIC